VAGRTRGLAGRQGPGHKTIIPAEVQAKLTFRLVSDQKPEDVGPQLRAWVAEHLPAGIEAEVHTPPGGVSPCSSDLDSPAMGALLAAIGQAWDSEPGEVLYLREGGSGPEADLVEVLGAPLVFLGAGLPTDRIHSPNERVLLSMLHRGAEAAAHLWRELGQLAV
jgi:acetylornithine deacetylase/succinyl-diaminopimelate desuccinylase-like protein